jgi:hypothetical protein
MIPVSRGSGNVILKTALFLAVATGATIVRADEGARMPAAGRACSGSLGKGGHHAIDQFHSHRHPEAWIEPAPGQANYLASAAGHHAETQHYRSAGAWTGLAAPRRPSLVVQKVRRIADAVDDDGLRRGDGRASSRRMMGFAALYPSCFFVAFPSASNASRTCLNSLRSALSTSGKCRSSLSSALTMAEPITTRANHL